MRQIILNEEQIQKLENFLGEVPFKFAQPILNMLGDGIQPEKKEDEKDKG